MGRPSNIKLKLKHARELRGAKQASTRGKLCDVIYTKTQKVPGNRYR